MCIYICINAHGCYVMCEYSFRIFFWNGGARAHARVSLRKGQDFLFTPLAYFL